MEGLYSHFTLWAYNYNPQETEMAHQAIEVNMGLNVNHVMS